MGTRWRVMSIRWTRTWRERWTRRWRDAERAGGGKARRRERRRAMEMADAKARGVRVGVREDWLELERAEEAEEASVRPDEVIEIPHEEGAVVDRRRRASVKELMRQSKAMIQVLKSDEALNEGFTGSDFRATSAAARAATQKMLDSISAASRRGTRRMARVARRERRRRRFETHRRGFGIERRVSTRE